MKVPRAHKKIGILAHTGNKNLGDETIFAAVIENVKVRCPHSEIVGLSVRPEDTQQRHNIKAFPIRRLRKSGVGVHESPTRQELKVLVMRVPWIFSISRWIKKNLESLISVLAELAFCGKSLARIRGIDLLLVAGSGQLSDHYGGPWGFPYTLLKWASFARIMGARVAFLSVGAGPIHSSLSRFFLKWALSLAAYRSYRDEGSKKLVESMGVAANGCIVPDLAYSLPDTKLCSGSILSSIVPVVGINPLPFFDARYWYKSDRRAYERYVKQIAGFATRLISEGYKILMFPTQLHADPLVIEDVRSSMIALGLTSVDTHLIAVPVSTEEDLFSAISKTDVVVATRFHGILISFLLHKPVLGIAYQPKSRELMDQMRQAEYVLDINQLDSALLMERFRSLLANREVIVKTIQERISAQRVALEMQYNQVIGPVHLLPEA